MPPPPAPPPPAASSAPVSTGTAVVATAASSPAPTADADAARPAPPWATQAAAQAPAADASPGRDAIPPLVAPRDAPADAAPPAAPVPAGASTSNAAGWILAFALASLAWGIAWRRSRRLAGEARRLERDRRNLHSAHALLQQQSAQLKKLAIHDPLTGVLNRQAFAGDLRELAAQAARFRRPLQLVVFDLDHFKAINDRQGHLAGDAALKLVAGIVREHLDSADLFGRFGGDEFLIACADQPLEACVAIAEAIRAAVEGQAPRHQPPLLGLTLSMGIAHVDAGRADYDTDALFAQADAALYEAKRRGRNRVVVADAALPTAHEPLAHRHL